MTYPILQARIHQIRLEAQGIVSLELRPASAEATFPPFRAGAHIDLHLAPDLVRSYSLLHPAQKPNSYTVAVLKDPQSRGGSRAVHEQLRVGQTLTLSTPRNHFELVEDAPQTVLIAGGIGITPLYAMLERLIELGRPAELVYCARSRQQAAFLPELDALCAQSRGTASLSLRFDDEHGAPPDIKQMLAGRSKAAHYYACGPGQMLDAFESACSALSLTNVHIERFSAKRDPVAAQAGSYIVTLKRSNKQLHVDRGVSLLDALLDAGADVGYSCREGLCGSCEVRVVSGDVDHRDSLLNASEQALNRTMMVCVSGCRSEALVLDL
ncbi:MAG: hypothetical protein RI884_3047 [Pseudomonadota bacterium]|jgi:ferredoxin-NADP reductase